MLSLLQESFSQMSVGGFVLVIGAMCAAFALMRGVFRMITASAMLAVAVMAGYWVWIETPGIGQRMMEHPPLWTPFVLPILAGFGTFVALQKMLRLLLRPFGNAAAAPSSLAGKITSIFLSLVPTSLICVVVATAVRHVGTLQEIEHPAIPHTATLLKQTIDQYIPPAWMQRLDPLTDPRRITLAKLVSMASEEHIPRAIPVRDAQLLQEGVMNDPRLLEMAKKKRFSEMLRDPTIQKALDDPRLQKALMELIHKEY